MKERLELVVEPSTLAPGYQWKITRYYGGTVTQVLTDSKTWASFIGAVLRAKAELADWEPPTQQEK